jgi:glycine oxidase
MVAPRIVVVGGGITGAFAAYFLAGDGCDVTLIEREGIGSQASGLNPGGLNPLHGTGIPGSMQALACESFQLHLAHWRRIEQLSEIRFAFTRPLRIHVALEDADIPAIERLHALHSSTEGFSSRWLESAELFALEGRLNRSALLGLSAEGSAKVDAHAYTRAVAAAANALGATLESGNVAGLMGTRGRAEAVLVDSRTIPCDGVIVATGPWGGDAAAWTGCHLPIEPLKGELLLVQTEQLPCRQAFAWRGAAVYGDGSPVVWLGGNEERAGFDRTPTKAARAFILEQVKRLMPGLHVAAIVKQTAALRPVTSDDMPVIGLAPGWTNVGLALAGGRKGMLYGAAMGLAAAELVTRAETRLPIAPCAPTRFSI